MVEKSVPKPSTKGTTKKGKQPEPVVQHAEAADEVLSDPVAEKLRQQRYNFFLSSLNLDI